MHGAKLKSIMTIEDARRNVQALLHVNRQLADEVSKLKVALHTERQKAHTWRLVAIITTTIAIVGWGLWIIT